MQKFSNKFWLYLTIALSLIFMILFFPTASDEVGLLKGAIYTIVGILVIWIVFFIRSYLFSDREE